MATKVFLCMERAVAYVQTPCVSSEEIASTSVNNPLSEQLPFMI